MTFIDGFVAPVAPGTDAETYRAFAAIAAQVIRECGALRVVEGWGEDVPHGKQTDLYRAVAAEEGERIVFSWIEWPDKATRDAGMAQMMADPRMQPGAMGTPPFDMKRMIFGGFTAILDEQGA